MKTKMSNQSIESIVNKLVETSNELQEVKKKNKTLESREEYLREKVCTLEENIRLKKEAFWFLIFSFVSFVFLKILFAFIL